MSILEQAKLRKCGKLAGDYIRALNARMKEDSVFQAAFLKAASISEVQGIRQELKTAMDFARLNSLFVSDHKTATVSAPHMIHLAELMAGIAVKAFGVEAAAGFLPAEAKTPVSAGNFRIHNGNNLASLCHSK